MDNLCVSPGLCNVIGPAVIDFSGNPDSVEDRCTYTLLSATNVTMNGKFKSGGSELDSTNEPPGVMISQSPEGVSVNITADGSTIELFYNGQYAEIFHTGGSAAMASGLCQDSTSLGASRIESASDACTDMTSQAPDDTIDCPAVKSDCSMLGNSTLFPCGSIDPAPYETLCEETLCKYPQLDGFICPFHEAYARACIRNGHALGDWRSAISCDVHDVFCPGEACVHMEFCGDTASGERRCRCRASVPRPDGFAFDPVCDNSTNSASVTVIGCLLTEQGFDFRALHLNDPTCTGQVDEATNWVTFTHDEGDRCGSVSTIDEDLNLVVTNNISDSDSSAIITTEDELSIEFSCFFADPEIQTSGFTVLDNSVVVTLTSGEWIYTLSMESFSDSDFLNPLGRNANVSLNDEIFVKIYTSGLDGAWVAVFTESCWATSDPSPDVTPRVDLITDGCGSTEDVPVNMTGNGNGTSNSFSYRFFQFTGHPGSVYLHCQVRLCIQECVPVCHGWGRRRSSNMMKFLPESPPVISMVWTP
ncbi:uromodulin-like [Brachionichthys hirsutus]|uniref:uromodulin-like n=1 Tax=Brachionichthys hirsutus TaxID=412623 RepID=UPI00360458B7